MLENVKKSIIKLIAEYEAEKIKNRTLDDELERCKAELETCKKQKTELERQIDNLNLKIAFLASSGDGDTAKKKLEKLIREIDRCISLLEK